jgi:hypothetical protein
MSLESLRHLNPKGLRPPAPRGGARGADRHPGGPRARRHLPHARHAAGVRRPERLDGMALGGALAELALRFLARHLAGEGAGGEGVARRAADPGGVQAGRAVLRAGAGAHPHRHAGQRGDGPSLLGDGVHGLAARAPCAAVPAPRRERRGAVPAPRALFHPLGGRRRHGLLPRAAAGRAGGGGAEGHRGGEGLAGRPGPRRRFRGNAHGTDRGAAGPSDEDVSAETRRARKADAFVRVAEAYLEPDLRPRSTAEKYQVHVHLDARRDAGGPVVDPDSPALAEETIRRLGCEAGLVPVLHEGEEILSVGRKTRAVPPAIRRALRLRDRGCRFPGCTHHRHVDAHHVRTGRTAARRNYRTWSSCAGAITGCCTRAATA